MLAVKSVSVESRVARKCSEDNLYMRRGMSHAPNCATRHMQQIHKTACGNRGYILGTSARGYDRSPRRTQDLSHSRRFMLLQLPDLLGIAPRTRPPREMRPEHTQSVSG